MKRNILFFVPRQAIRRLWACMLPMVAAALLMGCSKVDDPHALPEGKHPITFAAAVEGLTVQKVGTRATGKDAWTADDQVSISTHADGSSPKTYKISNASTGAMAPDNTGDVLYWQLSKNQPIRAWYPATDVTNADISNQSGGYADYDYLTSDGTYDFASSVSLSFKHQMAKVKYTLQKGEGITDTEFSSATVQIYGFTKANFAGGMLTGNTPGWITPHATDKEAILVPQQMQNQQFIKVTIGTSDAARDYYYTPAGATDADLAAGKQYTYDITVKKTGLKVTVGNSLSWSEGSPETDTGGAAVFRVEIPTTDIPSITVGGDASLQSSGIYHVSSGKSFTITYTVNDFAATKGFPVADGLCEVTRTYNTSGSNTYTFTYTRIRSDLKLAYDLYGEPDDFYCKDAGGNAYIIPGSVSLSDDQKSACLGIVFWKRNPTDDDWLLREKHPGCTHGLVVALNDVNSGSKVQFSAQYDYSLPVPWNIEYPKSVSKGYAYTVCLQQYNEALPADKTQLTVLPIAKIAEYATSQPAPASSSGWYWPHYNELQMLFGMELTDYSTNSDETKANQVSKQLMVAGGTGISRSAYWSSIENGPQAVVIRWANNRYETIRTHEKYYSCKVRCVLAF